MAFQECDDIWRVLNDAGLASSFGTYNAGRALMMAYNKSTWEELAHGSDVVAEDRQDQYYGHRAAGWLRLRHKATGRTVFLLNHHGPLPVNTGGRCGPQATAYRLLRVVGTRAADGDAVVLAGDLNADVHSGTQAALLGQLDRAVEQWVDAIFSGCPAQSGRRLGTGGSDHEALEATLRL